MYIRVSFQGKSAAAAEVRYLADISTSNNWVVHFLSNANDNDGDDDDDDDEDDDDDDDDEDDGDDDDGDDDDNDDDDKTTTKVWQGFVRARDHILNSSHTNT